MSSTLTDYPWLDRADGGPNGQGILDLIETAAKTGTLHDLPPEFLTLENLTQVGTDGEIPVHGMAANGQLYLAPSGLLIEKYLLWKDRTGWTPLHYAAQHEFLEQVPIKHINPITMQTETINPGVTPLRLALNGQQQLKQRHFLNETRIFSMMDEERAAWLELFRSYQIDEPQIIEHLTRNYASLANWRTL